MRRRFPFTPMALLLTSLGAVACAGTEERAESPLEYTENAKTAYEEALDAYFDSDWEDATLLMQEVRRKYAYSRYARLAQLRIADAAFRQGQFPEAITEYKTFVHDYPNDPEVVYARFRIVKAHYEQAGEALLLPPLEERDLAVVVDGHQAARAFLADYPGYKAQREVEHHLEVLTGVLARHEIYVARFYLAEDRFEAAAARAQHALRAFERSGLEPEAMVLLAETYMKMKRRADARVVLSNVLAKYPDSPFIIPAREFLKHLDEPARD